MIILANKEFVTEQVRGAFLCTICTFYAIIFALTCGFWVTSFLGYIHSIYILYAVLIVSNSLLGIYGYIEVSGKNGFIFMNIFKTLHKDARYSRRPRCCDFPCRGFNISQHNKLNGNFFRALWGFCKSCRRRAKASRCQSMFTAASRVIPPSDPKKIHTVSADHWGVWAVSLTDCCTFGHIETWFCFLSAIAKKISRLVCLVNSAGPLRGMFLRPGTAENHTILHIHHFTIYI